MKRCIRKINNIGASVVCENNMPGVQRLLFIPRKDVESINAVAATVPTTYGESVIIGSPAMVQKAITVKSGKEFAEIYCADELGELVYTPQGQHGSRSFKAELEIFHPGFKEQLLGYMSVAINREYIFVVGLSNGDWHLLGDVRRGAKMADNSRATSGKAVTDANGGELHFEYSCQSPRVFFVGWDPDNEVYGVERFRTAYVLGTEDGFAISTEDGYLIEIEPIRI